MPNLRSTSKSRGRNSADTLRSLMATAKRKERSSRSVDGSNSANDPPSKGIAGSSPIKSPAKSKSRTPDVSQQATPPSIPTENVKMRESAAPRSGSRSAEKCHGAAIRHTSTGTLE
mmetsp:Transcript_19671/g.42908  ORF Transcript_19671/g.42908 Transcript_19671/m.42908 type:complete len:116 (-) Transcript_19671:84-431(-)|eukprot:CAMPEP_0178483838 /NCGR_PEP_ID=MMETSP0696-20121128/7441_1 /TAXON_ID=265572 /ORGANISM="Extubocellulus spinifer, Strain CCMP396" /LENGTH=115 /DNA_ID=CAMNT_0020111369 /DNA_START=30 /DNA_END=377 /DNA_ORIENTATION=+